MTQAETPLEAALGRALSTTFGEPTTVAVVGRASTGATRRTLFTDLTIGASAPRPTVTTINNPAMNTLAVSTERRCLDIAADVAMPAPATLAHGDGNDDIGGSFLVTERLDGETVPRRVLRSLDDSTSQQLTIDLAAALARLHTDCPPADEELQQLPAFADSSEYAASLLPMLEALPQKSPALALGHRWLVEHPPEQPRTTLVHGDYRLGNFIVADGSLAAVLDWELAHFGDPMEDVAWLCLRSWRFGNDAKLVGGFGELEVFGEAYAAAGGTWRPHALHWWLVARSLWWGIMLAHQAAVFVAGGSDAIVLAASGRRVAELEFDILNLIA